MKVLNYNEKYPDGFTFEDWFKGGMIDFDKGIKEGIIDFDDGPVSEIEIFYFRPLTIEEAAKMKTREEKDAMDIREHELEMLKHLTEKYKNDKTML